MTKGWLINLLYEREIVTEMYGCLGMFVQGICHRPAGWQQENSDDDNNEFDDDESVTVLLLILCDLCSLFNLLLLFLICWNVYIVNN